MPPRSLSSAELQQLLQKVEELQSTVSSQQELIAQLQVTSSQPAGNANNPLNSLKSPPIPIFTGKSNECNSTNVKGFISNVRRVGRLSNSSDEAKLLQLAECHLQERASNWITRLEDKDEKPSNLKELQEAMLKEFVPSNEKARAQLKLMTFKMRGTIDKHIEEFMELIETCSTPTREAYEFFFMSVSQYLKGKLSEEFPESDPSDMRDVYRCARKHEIAEKWASGKQENTKPHNNGSSSDNKVKADKNRVNNKDKSRTQKDLKAECWGPALKGEGRMYREDDRCCKCGKKPWSDPTHPCRLLGQNPPRKEEKSKN